MMKKADNSREPLADQDLEAALGAQISSSIGYGDDPMSVKRAELLSVYLRHGYNDDHIARSEDRSDTIDSTCADTVENILAELVEMMMAADTIANFTANNPDDEAAARQETEAVHNIFFTQNRGYLTLVSWLWDGLTTVNGYVKAWHETRDAVRTVTYTGQDEESMDIVIADLESDGVDVEVLDHDIEETQTTVTQEQLEQSDNLRLEAQEADEVVVDEEARSFTLIRRSATYRLKLREKKSSYKIEPVPSDEILISPLWKSVDLQDCPFVGHRYCTTQSDLIARGFERDQVENLPTFEGDGYTSEGITRFDGLEQTGGHDSGDASSRQVEVIECWTLIDRDGDGISERVMATVSSADNALLRYEDSGDVAVEDAEEVPIHSWTPFIIPHRHHGESVVERSKSIQRTKTLFQRQLSDSVAFSGNPRLVLGKNAIGPDTIDDSMVYRPGGLIRAGDASQVIPMKMPSCVADIMPVLDYWQDRNEERTGATRINQGLVADKFGKNVAGITIAQLQKAGMNKINMIARNFLETGFASLMCHLHSLLRRHQNKEMFYQMRGEWVSVDPTNWGERSEVKAGLGLGSESIAVKSAVLREIIDRQVEAITAGSAIADEEKVYNALSDLANINGLRNPDRYLNNPANIPPAPEEADAPSPEQILGEAQLAVAKQEAETRVKALAQKENDDARQADLKRQELDLKERQLQLDDDFRRDAAALRASGEERKQDVTILRDAMKAPSGVL